jgi:hypothetical protein
MDRYAAEIVLCPAAIVNHPQPYRSLLVRPPLRPLTMPALELHPRQEPTIESSSPPSPKPEIEDPEEPPAPKEPPASRESTTTRRSTSAEPTETGGGLAGLFGFGDDETSSSSPPPTRTKSATPTPEPTIEDSGGFFGFGGDDETTSSSRPTARPTSTRTYSHDAEPTETGPGLFDRIDNVVKSCGGSADTDLLSDSCKDVAQDNWFETGSRYPVRVG